MLRVLVYGENIGCIEQEVQRVLKKYKCKYKLDCQKTCFENFDIVFTNCANINTKAKVVLVSDDINAICDAIRHDVFRCIKPVDINKGIEEAIFTFLKYYHSKSILLSHNKVDGIVKVDNIYYIEHYNKMLSVVHNNGVAKGKDTMKSLEQRLKDFGFNRCHASYIVNFNYVECLAKDHFVLTNGKIVPISKARYKKVWEEYKDFCKIS